VNQHIFITLSFPGRTVLDTLMMIASIRDFAGNLANNPIWILVPKALGHFNDDEQVEFADLNTRIIPFDADVDILKFTFGAKVQAAAIAEEMSLGQTKLLTWLDSD